MKKLREKLSRSSNQLQSDRDLDTGKPKTSFYMAGEYGTQHRRPHFHACLFGIGFKDAKPWRTTSTGSKLYTSEELDKTWGKGFTSIGEVNFESAAYIARYIMTKITGDNAAKYYEHIHDDTGEIEQLLPEYNKMSLREPIGKPWLDKFHSDVYPEGEILVRGHKSKAPKYYDKIQKRKEPQEYEEMKMQRELQAMEYRQDNTDQRLKAKERVKLAQVNQLLRKL